MTRGQCQVIDDPKTPFHEEASDEEMDVTEPNQEAQTDVTLDPATEQRLQQAQ